MKKVYYLLIATFFSLNLVAQSGAKIEFKAKEELLSLIS